MQKLVNILVLVFFTSLILVSCKKDVVKESAWLKQDLLAHYPFNGNAKDSSGNGFDGVVNGALLTTDRNGKANSAYTFVNNTFIALNLNETQFSGNYSISIWAQLDNTSIPDPNLIRSPFFFLNYKGNTAQYGVFDKNFGGAIIYTANVDAKSWNHISVTCKNDTTRFYLNGTNLGSAPYPVRQRDFIKGNSIIIGREFYGNYPQYYNFVGKIDDIRFYKRALTDDEVKYLYQN